MLEQLRSQLPKEVAGLKVSQVVDRRSNTVTDMASGRVRAAIPICDPKTGAVIEQLQLATDNLLVFHLAGESIVDGGFLAVRPSGTEPKCKFYVSVYSRPPGQASDADFGAVKIQVDARADAVKSEIVRYATGLV